MSIRVADRGSGIALMSLQLSLQLAVLYHQLGSQRRHLLRKGSHKYHWWCTSTTFKVCRTFSLFFWTCPCTWDFTNSPFHQAAALLAASIRAPGWPWIACICALWIPNGIGLGWRIPSWKIKIIDRETANQDVSHGPWSIFLVVSGSSHSYDSGDSCVSILS